MDGHRFDAIGRSLASALPRRQILKILLATAAVELRSLWQWPRFLGDLAAAQSERVRRFTAPFDRCDEQSAFRPSNGRNELQIYQDGFAGEVQAECAPATGKLSFTVVAFGGTEGHLGIGGDPENPSALGTLSEAAVVEFTPAVSGQVRIDSSITVTGTLSTGAGSGMLDLPDSIADILEFLLPTKYGALLDLAKASLQPTHGDAVVSILLDISGHREVYGGGLPTCSRQVAAAASTFTGLLPIFPYWMDKRIDGQTTDCSVVVNVDQGKPVRIVAGVSSRVRAWGMASAVARVDSAMVNEVVVELMGDVPAPAHITPGGLWVTPEDGIEVTDAIVPLAALAYPAGAEDPPVDHVEFTAWWPDLGPKDGPWALICSVEIAIAEELYACDADFAALGIPPGEVSVSFDVYDVAGNRNLAPHGLRAISWAPLEQTTSLPTGYIGNWEGVGTQTDPVMEWPVQMTFASGNQEEVVGSVTYPSLGCVGELRLLHVATDSVELAEDITTGEGICVDGGTFALVGAEAGDFLSFRWTSPDGTSVAEGTLTRITASDKAPTLLGAGSPEEAADAALRALTSGDLAALGQLYAPGTAPATWADVWQRTSGAEPDFAGCSTAEYSLGGTWTENGCQPSERSTDVSVLVNFSLAGCGQLVAGEASPRIHSVIFQTQRTSTGWVLVGPIGLNGNAPDFFGNQPCVDEPGDSDISPPTDTSLPEQYVGDWVGTGTQTSPPMDWPVTMVLRAGPVGEVVGSVSYPSLGCIGDLSLIEIDAASINLIERITAGNCVDGGSFVLSVAASDSLQFEWMSPDSQSTAEGALTRPSAAP